MRGCIVTATEKEALLLENTLIKRHRPPFNIVFRDDKEYLLLRIDRNEEFPRPELVRRAARDGTAIAGAEVENNTAAISTAISGEVPRGDCRRRCGNLDKSFILANKTAAM